MGQYYPIALRLTGKECLVVGGGEVAFRKAEGLLECGARVRVVSPVLCTELQRLAEDGRVQHCGRDVEEEDLAGAFLIIGATDQREVNRRVGEWAAARQQLVNIVDQPGDCNFILPAVHRVGALTLTVNTDGKSPALAAKIRRELAERYTGAYAVALEWLGEIRFYLLAHLREGAKRREILLRMAGGEWLILLQAGDGEGALRWLAEHLPEVGDAELLWTRLQRVWEEMRDGL